MKIKILVPVLVLALMLVLALPLVSCGADEDAFATDVPAASLGDAIQAEIGSREDYMMAEPSDYSFYFNDDPAIALINDSTMRFHPEVTNVNELGVFRTASVDDAKEVERMVKAYLDMQTTDLRSFAKNYSPEDLAKIDAARVERVGAYVVYLVLSPEHADAAMARVRAELQK